MKNKIRLEKSDIMKISFVAITLIVCLILFIVTGIPRNIGADRTYFCDVKSLNLNTKIQVNDENGDTLFTAKGDIIKFIEDPLTLYNSNGNQLFHADDTYHLINQDSHTILGNNGESYELVGDFNLLGDSYVIYKNGQQIAEASFNAINTHGELRDNDGEIIADYTSRFGFNDFIIQTRENSLLSDESLIMIFASYYSDQHADS